MSSTVIPALAPTHDNQHEMQTGPTKTYLKECKGYFGQQASTDQCPSSNVHPIKAKAPSAHIPGREGMKAAEGARACSTSGVILRRPLGRGWGWGWGWGRRRDRCGRQGQAGAAVGPGWGEDGGTKPQAGEGNLGGVDEQLSGADLFLGGGGEQANQLEGMLLDLGQRADSCQLPSRTDAHLLESSGMGDSGELSHEDARVGSLGTATTRSCLVTPNLDIMDVELLTVFVKLQALEDM
ncbi:MAG: hypothetical protein FRX49_11971 [Trebouxia sp. A1-2]|nr:MAG: hypothetical protein FRX49_11971 [Trebouxia sp. A1-2]